VDALGADGDASALGRRRAWHGGHAEEYDRTGSTSAAVISGLGRTGRLVTSAALILFLTFVAMASGLSTDLKIFATAWARGSSSTPP
jgi:hypothetical protein